EGSEHAVGHRLQPPAVGFELRGETFVHGCQNDALSDHFVTRGCRRPRDQGPGRKAGPIFVPPGCHISGAGRVIEGMTARMNNPAKVLPDSMKGIQSIIEAAHDAGVPSATMVLAHLRASQVNGCSPCVYSGAVSAKKAGESDERLFAVAAWRETDLFTDAERAALDLAE